MFEEWLVDHETACNVGNWMWLSCTAFFSMFYRVYSPVAFGRKMDAEGKFVKHFVPELEKTMIRSISMNRGRRRLQIRRGGDA